MSNLVIEGFRLSPQQKRLWLLQREAPVYLSQCATTVEGPVDAEVLRRALESLVSRHEILRTTFRCLPGMDVPVQVIEGSLPVSLDVVRLDRKLTPADVEAAVGAHGERPFDFEGGPLLRASLLEPAAGAGALVVSLPAICADSLSLKNLLAGIRAAHEAIASGLTPDGEAVQYADFSEWQNELLKDGSGEEARTFWERERSARRPTPALPFETGSAPAMPALRSHLVRLAEERAAAIESLAARRGATPALVLLGCWEVLLLRLTGERSFPLSVLQDGRSFEQLEGALGLFARYLPIECRGGDDFLFPEILELAGQAVQEAAEHQDYFVEDGELRVAPPAIGFDYADWRDLPLLYHSSRIESFKLRLSCVRTREGLWAEIVYDAGRFEPAAVERLGGQLERVILSVLETPEAAVSDLEILSEAERRQVVSGWNDTARVYPGNASLPGLFAAAVARAPEVPAVLWGGEALSFAELDRRSNQVAHRLRELGAGPESRVGLCFGRGADALVGLWGIWKAGAAYVPIDPGQPLSRREGMLRDAGVTVAVREREVWPELAELSGVRELLLEDCREAPETDPGVRADGTGLAYVLYTSGSTGRPKGVMVRQVSVVNLARALCERVYEGAGEGLRVSVNAPLTFDASVKQVIQLLWGHTLVVVPEEVRADGEALLAYLVEEQVEVLDCTPSQLHLLLEAGLERARTSLQRVLVGGEAISAQLWSRLAEIPGVRFFNVYGPTECTVDATAWEVGEGRPVLGRAIANVQVYVLDRSLRPVPVGLAGELCIGGAGVGRGYVGRPDLTAERFVPGSAGEPGSRLYRTGDLARWGEGGLLEYLGRVDHQVKLRGVRIELGEIESLLREHGGVEEAVVALREDEPGDVRLVAYVVPRRSHRAVVDGRARRELPNGMAVVEQNRNETEYLYEEIFAKKSYLRHGVGLPEGACVFDVGANVGMFTLFVKQQCPTARIYAFEPIAPIYETLRLNAELYAPGAKLFAFGLSDAERSEAFTYYPRYSMMSSQRGYSRPDEEVEVVKRFLSNERSAELLEEADELLAGRFEGESQPGRLRRLSQVLREEGVEKVDLLKIDVQRAELDVLRGLDDADWERVDQVVMEVHDARGQESEGRSREIVSFLEARGFRAVAEQDELLEGTDRYNLYAVRESHRPAAEAPAARPEGVLNPGLLREFAKQRLPEVMVPSAVVLLDELPLTRHSKVDRSALPAPEPEAGEASALQEARTPFEEVLSGIWSEVLRVPRVGMEESFFDLGGHSLLATQLVSRVREVFRVDLPLRLLFESPTVSQLAQRVEEAMRAGTGSGLPPLGKAPRDRELPLSFSQQRLWFLDQLLPGSAMYNSPQAVRLEGDLDVSALEAVLGELVRRHETLRTTFPVVDGKPVQRIAPAGRYRLSRVDLSGLGAARETEAACLAAEEGVRPFDLARGPLLRTVLLRLGESEHVLLFSLHHIVSDAWSLGVLVREVVALYEAYRERRPSPLPELPIQYVDYAWWQRQWLQGEVLRAQVEYWRSRLGESPEALELPADRPRSASRAFRGASLRLSLGRALSAAVRDLSHREGATPFMTLLAGFQALLHRYTGLSGINVGTPIAGRRQLETEGLIGFFVNTLVLHGEIAGERSFRELLAGVREASLGAYAHQDLPFEKLVEEIAPERDTLRSPLFQVMLTFQNTPVETLEARGLRFSPVDVEIGTVKFDLTLRLADDPEVISGELQYSSDLFDATTMLRFGRHLQALLAVAVADPGRPLGELPLHSEAERHQILREWNDTAARDLDRPCLHELFEARAARTPEAPVVIFRDEVLTCAELDRRAEALARRLRAAGVGPEARVALWLERSLDVMVGLLGVLKAGGAYLPLDPKAPAARLAALLEDAGVEVVVTRERMREALPGGVARVLCLDSEPGGGSETPSRPGFRPIAGNLAYVLYTSGSTGAPKGVAVEHNQAVSYLRGIVERLGLPPGASYATVSTFAADLGNTAIFPALFAGGCLHIVPDEVVADPEAFTGYLSSHAIDCLKIVPSHLAALLTASRPERVLPRRLLVLGGEAASEALIERLSALAPECALLNHYGPTETTVGVLTSPLPPSGVAPLGRPIAGVRVYVLDRGGLPVPPGAPGELCIGGRSVSRGYLGVAEATAAKFVPDPFGGPGGRLYRTGDLARHLPDGRLEFLGRIDHQVKIRGFRIEPGEIEATLRACPGVREAVVAAREEAGDRRLVAWVVPDRMESFSAGELRERLRAKLPEPLIPGVLVPLAALPLTPNGKVDRRALPAPEPSSRRGAESASPRTFVEQLVAALWGEVLGLEVGLHDDFFALGGHSLLATRAISRVRQAFQREIPLRTLFEAPTVSAFAAAVEKELQRDRGLEAPPIERIPRTGTLPLSFAQQRLWFLDQLDPDRPDYNIPLVVRLRGALRPERLERSLREIARRHEVLRTTFDAPGGEPVQVVHPAPSVSVPLPVTDLRSLGRAEREAAALGMAAEEALRPFSLARGPLLRAALIRLEDEDHLVLLTLHHIVSDEWSRGVFLRELIALYEAFSAGRPAALPELPVQYADYAAWQRRRLQGEVLEAQVAYWREGLAGSETPLDLPVDRPRPAVPSFRGRLRSLVLDRDLTGRLESLGRQEGATAFMTFLAAFQALLAAVSGQEGVSAGTPISGRNRLETEGLIGFFVNTLVLRLDLSGNSSFRQALGRVRETALGAYTHQDVPFEKLVDELQPQRDLAYSPLFQAMFALQHLPREEGTVPGLEMTPLEIPAQTVKFDLMLSVSETPSGLKAELSYRTDLFDGSTAARLLENYVGLLESVAASPDRPLSETSLLRPEERHQLLVEWGLGSPVSEPPACLHDLFAAQAARTPEALAVIGEGGSLTYRELERRAARLAARLRSLGAGAEELVGVCLEPSPDLIAAILGVLAAGGVYLPLDPDYPAERLALLLEDSGARRVVTRSPQAGRLPAQVETVLLDWEAEELPAGEARPDGAGVSADHLAYVIYTSGSTGRPRGVGVSHGAAAAHFGVIRRRFGITAADRVLQFASPGFDVSLEQIFPALLTGATVVLRDRELWSPEDLLERLVDLDLTVIDLPAAYLHRWVRSCAGLSGPVPSRLRLVLGGGEAMPPEAARLWRQAPARHARLLNAYGPTEAVMTSNVFEAGTGLPLASVPIGSPLPGRAAHVLDRRGSPVPLGVPGELYLGGPLARGYLGRPELTAERFVPDPFGGVPGGRLYRTGDLVRWLPSGVLEFLGRIDQQVKVRGFRIELGEIEAALGRLPGVEEAVVVAREEASGSRSLVAYVVQGTERVDAAALRARLREHLPEPMIPPVFVELAALPLTPNGKVDRRALPAPERVSGGAGAGRPPGSPAEEILARIWAEVLGRERVGVHDNFFELGGDSILSIQVVSRARQAGLHLTPRQVFQHQTLAELASEARQAPASEAEQGAVTGEVPLSPIASWFLGLGLRDPNHFNQSLLLAARRAVDAGALGRAVKAVARHHDALRLRLAREGAGWRQWIAEPEAAGAELERIDLSTVPDARLVESIEAAAAAAQASLDLAAGPVFRALWLDPGSERPARLLLVIHHLAVDGVSWRIMLEDLAAGYEQALRGEEPRFPAKTTSVQEWSRRIRERAREGAFDDELGFWLAPVRERVSPLPVDRPERRGGPPAKGRVQIAFDVEETRALLHDVPEAYRTQVPEALLAVLARAFSRWTGRRSLLVDLEGHGREDLFEGADLSRTVGWFTSVYPVLLEIELDASSGEDLKAVKEQLRAIPRRGAGYGSLLEFSAEPEVRERLRALPRAEVVFNFHGQLDAALPPRSLWEPARESKGPNVSPGEAATHLLSIDGAIFDGRLEIGWTHGESLDRSTVERLAAGFRSALRSLLEHCRSPQAGGYTPADFPLAGVDASRLERLLGADRSVEDLYPLSPLQRGLLFHALYDPGSEVYFEQLGLRLEGDLDPVRFRRAWERVVERHPILRTAFLWEGLDEPLQVVRRQVELPWEEQDWREEPEDGQARRLETFLEADRRKGFDPARAPLMRLTLLRLREDAWYLTWSNHHLLLDGWCLSLVFREVTALYEGFAGGSPPSLPPVRPYRAFIDWLRHQDPRKAERYWRGELAGFSAPTDLGLAPMSGADERGSGGELSTRLSAAATARLTDLARRRQLTLNTLVQGAWALLLARSGGERDVVFGAVFAGRPPELAGAESMLGLFANTLPVRARLAPEQPLLAFLADLQARLAERLQYEHSPLAEVQRWSDVPAGSPLFESLLAFESYPVDETVHGEVRSLRLGEVRFTDRTHYPVTLVAASGTELRMKLRFDRRRLDETAAVRMLERLRWMLEEMGTRPESRIGELSPLPESERHQILLEWNAGGLEPLGEACLHDLFSARAVETPHATAVVCGDAALSYGELERVSNRLAHRLRRLGVGPEVPVALCLERSLEMIVGVLGVLKAGGLYVPLDPAYPRERLAWILEDAGPPVLLTQGDLAERLPACGARLLRLDVEATPEGESEARPVSGAQPGNAAYVIYTSGSTGQPKGVVVTHRNVARLFAATEAWFGFGPQDVWTLFHSYAFDFSVWEIWGALLYGGRLVVVPYWVSRSPEELVRLLRREGVTVLNQTPSAFRELLQLEESFGPDDLRVVVFGGEALDAGMLSEWLARRGDRAPRLVDMYGITETTVHVTYGPLSSQAAAGIGRPIPDLRVYLLDGDLQPVPLGLAGEIHVGGAGLSRGYLGRPDLTAERFVPDPFGACGGRLYRSGDLGRLREDGTLEFLGRRDHQVKIRGFRIELGEIEAALHSHPAVRQAAVTARGERDRRLIAHLEPEAGTAPVLSELRSWLRERLPEHMVPAGLVLHDSLPLLPNGKVDRRTLAALQGSGESPTGSEPPRTPTEEIVAGIWTEVLGLERVGASAHFFELGGHSLLATRAVSRLRDAFGVELPLRELFEEPTVAGLAGRVEALLRTGPTEPAPALTVTERPERLTLSFAQERLWFLDQLQPGGASYNIPIAQRIAGRLDVPVLAATFGEIVRRHEVLRTVYAAPLGEPVQVVAAPEPFRLPLLDLSGLPEPHRGAESFRLAGLESAQPFDLSRDRMLLRASLVRFAPEEHVVLATMHHIASDGWSMGILMREVAAVYEAFSAGRPSPLPPLPVQYADFALWQRSWLCGAVLEAELAYWRERLDGAPPLLDLPLDRPRPAEPDARGGSVILRLPQKLSGALEALARGQGATLFMVLLAGFQALLSRYGGQEDVSVGAPVAGRTRSEIEGLIGFFVNTLVLRLDLGGDSSFRQLLGRARETALGAYLHQDLPFERLVDELQPERNLSYSPLFQVTLALQNVPFEERSMPGLTLSPLELPAQTVKFDLMLSVSETASGLAASLGYRSDLFDGSTAARLLEHFASLLEHVVGDPDLRLSEAVLLRAEERQQLLDWARGRPALEAPACLHELFSAQAARTPEAAAVSFEGETWSYGELDRRANRLAHHLRELGVGPEVPVALCLERSFELVEGVLAVLKAGGGYLPLDPDSPRERLAWLLEDSRARVVVTREDLAERLPDLPVERVLLDADAARIAACSEAEPDSGVRPENLAYVIYTSGSTGRPKGVMVPHANVSRLFAATRGWFDFGVEDVWSLFHSYAFDFSVWELWGALLHGGRLVVVPYWVSRSPESWLELLVREGVTVLNQTPSAFHPLVHAVETGGSAPSSLRWVIFGGEALEPLNLSGWFGRFGDGRPVLVNMYGITETTVHVTYRRLGVSDVRRGVGSPIGEAIADLRVHVLDARMRLVPLGVAGELYVGGAGLARGYLGRPELTAERFVPDPFARSAGERLYRTGDLARRRADGQLDYLGRLDHQVKIRGFRIELGEIEAALTGPAGVREAVVLAGRGAAGDVRLTAYVVPGPGAQPTVAALRSALREVLPDYMVPSGFMLLESLPLTSNGKVDRRALAALEGSGPGEPEGESELLRTPAEEIVAGIWSEVLERDRVGAQDNFFELGGHSLLATRVVSRLRDAFGVELPLRELFEEPVLADLASRVDRALAVRGDVHRPPIGRMPGEGASPLSSAQMRLWLVHQVAAGDAAYNIHRAVRLEGALDLGALQRSLDEIVRRHEALRTNVRLIGDQPVQVIAPAFAVALPLVDLSAFPSARGEEEARRLAREAAGRPFDLSSDRFLRALLLRFGPEDHAVFVTLNHIAADGWSLDVFVREMRSLYEAFRQNLPSPLLELPIQYADYASWQQQWLRGEDFVASLDYWKRLLSGAPALALPTDRPREARRTYRGALETLTLGPELSAALLRSSRGLGVTPFMTFLAVFDVLLHHASRQEDIVVGTNIAGRNRRETEGLIGLFLNQLVLRSDLSGNPTFRQLLERVRRLTLDAYTHQDVPFDRLVEALRPQRDAGGQPLFQVKIDYQKTLSPPAPELASLRLSGLGDAPGVTHSDLTLYVLETGEGIDLFLQYSTEIFDRPRILGLLAGLRRLIERIVESPDATLSELDAALAEDEKRQFSQMKSRSIREVLQRKRGGSQ